MTRRDCIDLLLVPPAAAFPNGAIAPAIRRLAVNLELGCH